MEAETGEKAWAGEIKRVLGKQTQRSRTRASVSCGRIWIRNLIDPRRAEQTMPRRACGPTGRVQDASLAWKSSVVREIAERSCWFPRRCPGVGEPEAARRGRVVMATQTGSQLRLFVRGSLSANLSHKSKSRLAWEKQHLASEGRSTTQRLRPLDSAPAIFLARWTL